MGVLALTLAYYICCKSVLAPRMHTVTNLIVFEVKMLKTKFCVFFLNYFSPTMIYNGNEGQYTVILGHNLFVTI